MRTPRWGTTTARVSGNAVQAELLAAAQLAAPASPVRTASRTWQLGRRAPASPARIWVWRSSGRRGQHIARRYRVCRAHLLHDEWHGTCARNGTNLVLLRLLPPVHTASDPVHLRHPCRALAYRCVGRAGIHRHAVRHGHRLTILVGALFDIFGHAVWQPGACCSSCSGDNRKQRQLLLYQVGCNSYGSSSLRQQLSNSAAAASVRSWRLYCRSLHRG